MTKQKLIDAEEEKRRLEEESAQVRGALSPMLLCACPTGQVGVQANTEIVGFRFSPKVFFI